MKKTVCRIFALLTCFALLLTGCSNSSNADAVTSPGRGESSVAQADAGPLGRYIQQDITPAGLNGQNNTLVYLKNGQIALVVPRGTEGIEAYISVDGAEWETLDTSGLNGYVRQHLQLELSTRMMDENGIWWIANYSTEGEIHLHRISPDGNGREIDVPVLAAQHDGGWMTKFVERIFAGNDNTVLLEVVNNTKKDYVQISCDTGEVINTFSPQGFPTCLGYIDGNAYLMGDGSQNIEVFTASDGKKADTYSLPGEAGLPGGTGSITVTNDGTVCYATSEGIKAVALGGSMVQSIIGNRSYAYASASFRPTAMLAIEDGSYWLACDEGNSGRVYRYVFDETTPANALHSLYVWAMEDNVLLREAISVFARENTDYDIYIEFGRDGEDSGRTDEDIIRTLNTQLLADDGPDVLILDGLPIQALIAGEMLMDLNGTIDKSGYYENILSSYSVDGKDYAYPAAFRLPFIVKQEGAPGPEISSLGNFSGLAEVLANPSNAYFGGYSHLFDTLYAAYAPHIFPGGNSVDEDALRVFLETTKAIVEGQGISGHEIDPITSGFVQVTDGGTGPIEITMPPSISMYGSEANQYPCAADILMAFFDYYNLDLLNSTPLLEPLPGNTFIPVCVAGVTAGAQNPDGGKLLVRTMLECQSETVARYVGLPGFLVKQGVELQSATQNYERMMAEVDPYDIDPPNPALVDWDKLIAKYTTPGNSDVILRDKLYAEARSLYAGALTLEDAVTNVLNNTQLYFAERQ